VVSGEKLITGSVSLDGDIQASVTDLAGGTSQTYVIDPQFGANDHNNNVFVQTSDGRFTTFYSKHSQGQLYHAVTDNPDDVSSWSTPATIGTNTPPASRDFGSTYSNPYRVDSDPDEIMLFWRGGTGEQAYSIGTYTPASQSWSWIDAEVLIDSDLPDNPNTNLPARPYTKYGQGDGRIGVAYNDEHPDRETTDVNNIYFAELRRDNGGTLGWFHADGTKVRDFESGPMLTSEGEKVFDRDLANPLTTGQNSWVEDVAYDAQGRPVITYATFIETDQDNVYQHQYHRAKWDGSQWNDVVVVEDAGGNVGSLHPDLNPSMTYYSGGIFMDPLDPDVLFVSREIDGVFEIERYVTEDDGLTWDVTAVTEDSDVDNFRPYVPGGDRDPDEHMVVFVTGDYDYYANQGADFYKENPFGEDYNYDTSIDLWRQTVPEPTTLGLLVVGGLAVLGRRRA
jgi:hypothetical protein